MKILNSLMSKNLYAVRFSGRDRNHFPERIYESDQYDQDIRNKIREWHYDYFMPHQDIYETEQRKSEFGIKQMIEGLIGKPVEPDKSSKIFTPESKNIITNTIEQTVEKPETIEIDFYSLNRLGLYNLGMCGENSCNGAMLNSYNMDEYLPIFKQCGIQRIIDLTRNGD